MTLNNYLHNNIYEVLNSLETSNEINLAIIQNIIVDVIIKKNKIFISGCGGSSSDSSHWAAELVARFEKEREGINAEALTTDMAVITAIANDYSFEEVFSRQLEAKAGQDDLFIAISTSGNSPSIVRALEYCKKHSIKSILLTGANKSQGSKLATATFHAPSTRTSTIQTVHQVLYHSICEFIEKEIL